MSFNPNDTEITNVSGSYPSTTSITADSNIIRIITDGDPFPAKAGNPFINDGLTDRKGFALANFITKQDIDLTFSYRGGKNSANPQSVQNDSPIGLAVNGAFIYSTSSAERLYNSVKSPPSGFSWNLNNFTNLYKTDNAGGYIDEAGLYRYINGLFVPNAFSLDLKFSANNEYYSSSSFGNDFMRHSDGHSKIVGYAFDGYPIYGPYGYEDAVDAVTRPIQMKSSYKLKEDDTHRPENHNISDKFVLAGQERNYELGIFVEDYQYEKGIGTLDEYNGRFCVTPEYPQGTYAYFITFEDRNLTVPAYPFIVGPKTKQKRTAGVGAPVENELLWNLRSGNNLGIIAERSQTLVPLPIANGIFPRIELISGTLPPGLRLEGTNIIGTPFEVERDTLYTFVLRATYNTIIEDRTYSMTIVGPDEPVWITNEGQLPVGTNNSLYVLDNALIDFQLRAIDTDLPAGDELEYFIAPGDGEIPPGLTLDKTGRISGIIEPLLALDREVASIGYDSGPYDTIVNDFFIQSDFGFSSFYYDQLPYDEAKGAKIPKKLNRYYPFKVTVTDGDTFVTRDFRIYLVGDDFLRADNTIMKAAEGVFTADNTFVRNPVWLTPSDLGFKRANNYVTLYLDVIESETLAGTVFYEILDLNPDGSLSELPPGLELDTGNGEIVGRIPYQPAITESYKFTIRATRFDADVGLVDVFGNYYEDIQNLSNSFKLNKLPRDLSDGVDDLNDLVFEKILINGREYTISKVDGNESEDYDVIYTDRPFRAEIDFIVSRQANLNDRYLFVNRLTESAKQRYIGSSLNLSTNESYEIQDVLPYLEYRISKKDSSQILVDKNSIQLNIGQTFVLGDWVSYDGNIYQLAATDLDAQGDPTLSHTVKAQTDESGAVITDEDGEPLVFFDNSKWSLQASETSELSESQNIDIFKRWLQIDFPQGAIDRSRLNYISNIYVDNLNPEDPAANWALRMPSTANSRIIALVKKYLIETNLNFTIHRDNEDRVLIDSNIESTPGLLRQVSQFTNLSIALFKDDVFKKTLKTVEVDEVVDLPFSDKTFDIRIIGEIDSTIEFITDSDLGELDADYISTLSVRATTTVPDTNLVYRIVSGKLPNGLKMNTNGDLIGKARQYANDTGLGLTTFDNTNTKFDGVFTTQTSFDREYSFIVEARDRFNLSAVTKEFKVKVVDDDQLSYTNIYIKPLLETRSRNSYRNFVSDPAVFPANKIYRPDDPEFGIQKDIKMLAYAGIENKNINEFVAGAAKNHKRTKFAFGDFKIAEAKEPGTLDTKYEVVYLEVVDPRQPKNGKAKNKFNIKTTEIITADSIQYDTKDDVTNLGTGLQELPVYGRDSVKFVIPNGDDLVIITRDSNLVVDADNNDFEIELRDSSNVTIEIAVSDAEPNRLRPKTNTIKADSNAIKVSDFRDQTRYLVNIDNMRDEVSKIGLTQREYLPLWMRTPQANTFPQELDYTTAIPVCYCKPGEAADILLNIQNEINNNRFNPKNIHFEFDRYIIDRTKDNSNQQYILFANYQFNE